MSYTKIGRDKNGVEFDIKDDSGWTPIMLSSSVGDQLLVRKLIGLGADLNAQNNFGSTCLHLAASKGHLEVVISYLLLHGKHVHLSSRFVNLSWQRELPSKSGILCWG